MVIIVNDNDKHSVYPFGIDPTTIQCIHHWVIETAQGHPGGSKGKCKKCKITQLFYNSIPETKHPYHGPSTKFDKEKS